MCACTQTGLVQAMTQVTCQSVHAVRPVWYKLGHRRTLYPRYKQQGNMSVCVCTLYGLVLPVCRHSSFEDPFSCESTLSYFFLFFSISRYSALFNTKSDTAKHYVKDTK